MSDMVIVAYRPKPGQEAVTRQLVVGHVPQLQAWGLATDRPHLIMQAADGTLVEVFEWHEGAVARAHHDPRVQAMWAAFAPACDYVKLQDLSEAADLFATFRPL
jgi:hypothetical protein